MSAATAVRRPARAASGTAVVVAVAAMWKLGASAPALAAETAGVALFAAGFGLWRRDRSISGALTAAAGIGAVVVAVALTVSGIDRLSGFIRLLPGLFGVFVLGAALVPVRGTGSRSLVKVGTALVFVAVLATGIFQAAPFGALLLAGAGTVVAWDAGEHAINVGEHLGRGPATLEIELVHVVGTGAVALFAVEVAKFAGGVGPSELSLASLALLLVAVVLLAAALHD